LLKRERGVQKMKIWKFEISGRVVSNEVTEVEMPKGAEILHAGTQRVIPCVWALVDPEAETETRLFYLAATGEDVPEGEYVGTVFQHGVAYVWHVFDVTEGTSSPAAQPATGTRTSRLWPNTSWPP